jgi:ABC-2 type transport system ATP-binding protein
VIEISAVRQFPVTGALDASYAQGLAIKVEDLRKTYGEVVAVDGISFSVREHEIFGILGPNGAGKTTTVEILEGLRPADSGKAMVAGVDVLRYPTRVKSLIGVQLQSANFWDNLRLTEIIDVFAAIYGRRVDAMAILTKVDLRDKAKAYTKHLSGGQKQRFSIATALVNEPRVIFLDEPTTGLDPQARRNLWELVRSLREEGATVVMTTHYLEEAEVLCDRVAIMDEGRIVTLDTPDALIERLLAKGFRRKKAEREANLEDVFIDLTGKDLRED